MFYWVHLGIKELKIKSESSVWYELMAKVHVNPTTMYNDPILNFALSHITKKLINTIIIIKDFPLLVSY
jgi:hypothetical protein